MKWKYLKCTFIDFHKSTNWLGTVLRLNWGSYLKHEMSISSYKLSYLRGSIYVRSTQIRRRISYANLSSGHSVVRNKWPAPDGVCRRDETPLDLFVDPRHPSIDHLLIARSDVGKCAENRTRRTTENETQEIVIAIRSIVPIFGYSWGCTKCVKNGVYFL